MKWVIQIIRIVSIIVVGTNAAMAIERVSVSSTGMQSNGFSNHPSLSGDGRFVLFYSLASNLDGNDDPGSLDAFIHDRETGQTENLSLFLNGRFFPNVFGNLSDDGRYVAFVSADDSTLTNIQGVYLHDRQTGATQLVGEVSYQNSHPRLSSDGRYTLFTSTSEVIVYDRDTENREIVSLNSAGQPGNAPSFAEGLSGDGRFVLIRSFASNFVGNDTNGTSDVFVRDRQTGETELVSVSLSGEPGNNSSGGYSFSNSMTKATSGGDISQNGRFIAFQSRATNLVYGRDTNGTTSDIYVRDRLTGMTERVSVSTDGEQGTWSSRFPSLSADGRFVVFSSEAGNLVENDLTRSVFYDVFLHDRKTGITTLINVSTTGEQANKGHRYLVETPEISADGHYITFGSIADNLVENDTNNQRDIFVTKNPLIELNDDLSVSLRQTSGAGTVGEYIRFRALLTNSSNQILTNCQAEIENQPNRILGYGKLFSFYTWPLAVTNPQVNQPIDIAPGETVQMNLAVLARESFRGEVTFQYSCDGAQALTLPFVNTVHLIAKTEPLLAEDYLQLNTNGRSELVIDPNSGNYWHSFTVQIKNTNTTQPTSANLVTDSRLVENRQLRRPRFCEPVDWNAGDWSCLQPRSEQLQVNLAAGETKKIRVFVHAFEHILNRPATNRLYVDAQDSAGETVARASIGIYTSY